MGIGNLHVCIHICGCIYISLLPLSISPIFPTHVISKVFRVKAKNGKLLSCCIVGMKLRIEFGGAQNSRERINKK